MVLEEAFGLAGWIEEPLETRWIQEIHGTWGLRRHNRAHPKRSCEWQLEFLEGCAGYCGALPRLRGRPVGDLGGARLLCGLEVLSDITRPTGSLDPVTSRRVPSCGSMACSRFTRGHPGPTARHAFRRNDALGIDSFFGADHTDRPFGSLALPRSPTGRPRKQVSAPQLQKNVDASGDID